jgi:hypothetical protein
MVEVFSLGRTAVSLKANMSMIEKRDTVYFIGQMAENMTAFGLMENSTVKANTFQVLETLNTVFGKMVNAYNG